MKLVVDADSEFLEEYEEAVKRTGHVNEEGDPLRKMHFKRLPTESPGVMKLKV